MKAPMSAPRLYFEDFAEGQVATSAPRLVTREEIIAFAAEFDPQPFHLDEEAGRASLLGGLSASGWHTCSILMRMLYDELLFEAASMGSPGVDELRWAAPVHPGDKLVMRRTVVETRVSKSRPDRGFVLLLIEILNQAGEVVMWLKTPMMITRRAAAQEGSPAKAPSDGARR
jgi:acyl dehydratase